MSANDKEAIITGTMARPSNPSVRLTALELPITTKIPWNIKIPRYITVSLKKEEITN